MPPHAAPRRCNEPGCRTLISGRSPHCSEHLRDTRPNSNARGYDSNWRKTRAAFLNRNLLCVTCLREGEFTPAKHVDHKTPLSQGGTNAEENLQALCHSCHSRKTASEDGGFRNPRKSEKS